VVIFTYLKSECSLLLRFQKTYFTHRQKNPVDDLTYLYMQKDYNNLICMTFLLTAQIGRVMWVWLLLLITGCSLSMGPSQPESAKGNSYKVNFQSENWTQKNEDRSDYVWVNKLDGRILLSNSFCDEFQDQPLDKLANKTFNTVDKLKIEKRDYTTFKNREAYRLEGEGLVDGVPVGLNLLNTRRNNCYFDFVSITPLTSAKEVNTDFEQFLDSVEFK
jgi:hypothetical protein